MALPGVQVLFAFLLAVPFAQGFVKTTDFQQGLFFGTLLSAAVASALLIAPSAYHRINFRESDKEQMLKTSNGLALGGLFFLALSIIGAVALIADFIYGSAAAVVSAAIGAVLFASLWFVLPIVRRDRTRRRTEGRRLSNRRPCPPDIGVPGFEPGISCSQSRRVTRLRYTP